MYRAVCRPQAPVGTQAVGLIDPQTAPLMGDPVAAAYAVGVAEEPYRHFATWVGWPVPAPKSMVVFYEIAEPAVVFCYGDPAGTAAVFAAATHLPKTIYAVGTGGHPAQLAHWYDFQGAVEMQRMVLPGWAEVPEPAAPAEPLNSSDIEEILALLQPEGMRLDAVQLRLGRYYGVRLPSPGGKGELVSVAAASLVSVRRRTALIGNITTRPGHRGHGYARAAVSALIRRLRGAIRTICLDVNTANAPAVELYKTLGFAPHSRHTEALGRLKS